MDFLMKIDELSKRFIKVWQNSDWGSLGELLADDVKLEIVGIEFIFSGKNCFISTLKSASKISFNQNTVINKFVADDSHAVIQLDSNRLTSFLNSPFPKSWEEDEGVLLKVSFFKTAIVLEWNGEKLSKMITIDTLVHPADFIADNLISQY